MAPRFPYVPRSLPVSQVNLDVNLADPALGVVGEVRRLGPHAFSGTTASAVDSLVTQLAGQSADIHRQTGELKDQTADLRKSISDFNALLHGLIQEQQEASVALAQVSPYDRAAYETATHRLRRAMGEIQNARTRFIASLSVYQGINGQPLKTTDISLDTRGMPAILDAVQVTNLVKTTFDKSVRTLDPTGEVSRSRKILVQFGDIPPDENGIRAAATCGSSSDGTAVITIGLHNAGSSQSDLNGLIQHEVTHAAQSYPGEKSAENGKAGVAPSWVTEGLADYVRYFADGDPNVNRNAPLTLLTSQNKWESGYEQSAEFLWWMNESKPGLITEIHQAAATGTYSDSLIYNKFGATSMEEVWRNFVVDAAKPR